MEADLFDLLRVERVGEYYAFRFGAFKTEAEADVVRGRLLRRFPKARVLSAYVIPDRIVFPKDRSLIAPDMAAGAESTSRPGAVAPSASSTRLEETALPDVSGPSPSAKSVSTDKTASVAKSVPPLAPRSGAPGTGASTATALTTSADPKAEMEQDTASDVTSRKPQPELPVSGSNAASNIGPDTSEQPAAVSPEHSGDREVGLEQGVPAWAYGLGGAAFLVLILLVAGWRRERARTEGGPDGAAAPLDLLEALEAPGSTQTSEPGRLPSFLEQRLKAASRDLSMVESNLLASANGLRTILVTSCFDGAGKTVAAVQTAYALASGGRNRVLLADWNPGHPAVHRLFHCASSPGLTDFLAARAEGTKPAAVRTRYDGLWVLPCGGKVELLDFSDAVAGPNGRNGADESRRNGLAARLAGLARDYDYVVFDGDSFFGASTAIHANLFDGVLLVVEAEKTKWEVVQQAAETIADVGGKVVGAVLNKRRFYIPGFLYDKL